MWNTQTTDSIEGMSVDTIQISGYQNDQIHAYFGRPNSPGPHPGIVLVHHMPGWDEFFRETARRFVDHGYVVISPNLYERFGHGTPPDVAASVRAEGGVSDESVIGDCQASLEYLRGLDYCNGKVGIIGTCSGGRQSFLVACRVPGFSALVDCWGGNIIMSPDRITEKQPVAPIEYTEGLSCPMMGIYGNEDQNPSADQVNQLEAELVKHGKNYEMHRYDDAGHGLWYYDRPMYRQEQAMDSWNKTLEFFGQNLK